MPKTLTINGERKEWLYLLRGRQEAPFAPHDIETVSAPGKDGAHLGRTNVELKQIDQPIGFTVRDEEHEQELLDELNAFLLTQENAEIQFDSVPGKTYIGRVTGSISDYSRPAPTLREGTITFLCEPYKYGPEKDVGLTGQGTIINVEGTQAANPTFEFDVLAPITFAMVSNGDEYMLIGRPVDVDQTVVDTRNTYFTERGQTLDQWTETPNDDSNGSLTTSGDAIIINDWGSSADDWHGGVLMRSIDATQDFEVEMYVYIRAENPDHTFLTGFNLYDENNNELGMMRVWDKTTSQTRMVAEGRVGPFVGQSQNYLISDANYNLQGQEVFGGIVRLKREGNIFTFYVARVTAGGEHVNTIERTLVDRSNSYAGLLKFIEFEIQNHGSSPTPNEIRVEYIKATELSQATQDETPYIAYAGDVIKFDHENESILINGEDATYLKDFGASYFHLQQGNNQLATLPNDLEGIVKYRPTYK